MILGVETRHPRATRKVSLQRRITSNPTTFTRWIKPSLLSGGSEHLAIRQALRLSSLAMRRCTRLRSGKKYINVDAPDDVVDDLGSHCDSTFDSLRTRLTARHLLNLNHRYW